MIKDALNLIYYLCSLLLSGVNFIIDFILKPLIYIVGALGLLGLIAFGVFFLIALIVALIDLLTRGNL